jgi:hypothetical protein
LPVNVALATVAYGNAIRSLRQFQTVTSGKDIKDLAAQVDAKLQEWTKLYKSPFLTLSKKASFLLFYPGNPVDLSEILNKDGELNWAHFGAKRCDFSPESIKRFDSILPTKQNFEATQYLLYYQTFCLYYRYVASYEDLLVYTIVATKVKAASQVLHKMITSMKSFEDFEHLYKQDKHYWIVPRQKVCFYI